ncbi:hypothetical protein KIPB_009414 [Kipferlia bialata]|uniref:Potassium channel domain-containing protein n=1 Tax=Kipferlia bialata TaxID=797122 RepID=A0A9K3D1P9_9EUKA|nr:hypothetical protein KIPB_009414 [Kipferlia bialata]|eukprot:g9414.t1
MSAEDGSICDGVPEAEPVTTNAAADRIIEREREREKVRQKLVHERNLQRLTAVEEGVAEMLRLVRQQQKPSKKERKESYRNPQNTEVPRLFSIGGHVDRAFEFMFHTNYTLVSLVDEILLLMLLCIMDMTLADTRVYTCILVIAILFQGVHLLFLAVVATELSRQVVLNIGSIVDMIECYFSLILLYAGMFTVLAYIDPDCFAGLAPSDFEGPTRPLCLFGNFLYFSSIAMADVGFGDIYPVSAVARAIVFTETLASVGLCCILFGLISYRVSTVTAKRVDTPDEYYYNTPLDTQGMAPYVHS